MKLRTKILMLTILLALSSLSLLGTLRTSARKAFRRDQKPPLFVLQTSEADRVGGPSGGAFPRTDPQGRVYVVADSELRIISSTGERLGGFHLPTSNSSLGTPFAVLNGGEIVVATCDEDALLTVFDASGKIVRKMGTLRKLDERNPARNRFLNLGRVEANPSGEVFYVSMFSPTPTVQKFSPGGKLLTEFSVNGAAVQYQLEQAKKFLSGKGSDTVGGFLVLKSAAVDPATGHLWIGVGGRSLWHCAVCFSGFSFHLTPSKSRRFAISLAHRSGSPMNQSSPD